MKRDLISRVPQGAGKADRLPLELDTFICQNRRVLPHIHKTMCCEICGRAQVDLTRHHLIPRTRHANKRARRVTTAEDRRQIALICRPCHNQIHALFTEKQLERDFNTLALLAAHPGMARFVEWIRTKPPGF